MKIDYQNLMKIWPAHRPELRIHLLTKFHLILSPESVKTWAALVLNREIDCPVFLLAQKSYKNIQTTVDNMPTPAIDYDIIIYTGRYVKNVKVEKKLQAHHLTDADYYASIGDNKEWLSVICQKWGFSLPDEYMEEEKYGATCGKCNEIYPYAVVKPGFICYPCRVEF